MNHQMAKGKMFQGLRAVLILVVAAGVLVGCQSGGGKKEGNPDALNDLSAPVKPENRYKVAVERAAFFRYSPQQAAGADQQVKKETRVELLGHLAGYSKVKLPSGDIGFVDSADVTHLSPKEIGDEDALAAAKVAAAQALLPTDPTGANNANIGNGGNYRPPSEAGRTEPLPVADPNPTASPPPSTMFRY